MTAPAARRGALTPVRLTAAVVGVLALVLAVVARPDARLSPAPVATNITGEVAAPQATQTAQPAQATQPAQPTQASPAAPPRWQTERVLPPGGMLIAYHGAPGTGALGVLGETTPEKAARRLARAAAPFERPGRPVRGVFELIVSIADAYPGKDGDFSHDVRKRDVRRYVEAARELGVLLVLDLQTGRSDFLTVAKRWRWALKEPHVGLALDPEWRMRRHQVPGRVIGSVRPGEVNRVSAWLSDLVVRNDLPEKVFMLHQFRTSMLPRIGRIKQRPGLQSIQHVDGFGTPGQKRATYATVARPKEFAMGFKLFYDEDVRLMGARAVHKVRPRVRFVSYQ